MSRTLYLALAFGLASLLLVLLELAVVHSPRPASAAAGMLFVAPSGTGTACTQAAPCSLTTALAQAASGDTLYLAGGTYTGTGAAVITLTKSITLAGGWDGSPSGPVVRDLAAHPSVVDGENARRGVYVSGVSAAVLDGLVVTGGNAAGLGGFNNTDAGGGIYIADSWVVVKNSQIISNSAGSPTVSGYGGGLMATGVGNVQLVQNRFVSNTSRWGGAVLMKLSFSSGSSSIRANTFFSNTARYGGGIYLLGQSNATVEANTLIENQSGDGGGIYISTGKQIEVRGNQIVGNQASRGGGIGINGGSAITLAGNLVLENQASFRGGGIHVTYNTSISLENNVVANNQAPQGSGLYFLNAAPTLKHTTLANHKGGDGVGLFADTNVTATLQNTIVVSHTVGISVTAGSTVTVEATLWGSGAWANGVDWGGGGTIITGTINIWSEPAFVNPAADDYRLAAGSAAIDAGVDAGITRDFEGDTRPIGTAPDLGADEFALKVYLPLVVR